MGIKSPDKVDMEVGQRIREHRQAVNLSQTALADELGVTFQQVQKYEKGINRVGAGRLTKIAHVLGVPVGSLLGADEETGATREANNAGSPLKLLIPFGAMRLLRAYAKLKDGILRRSIVGMVERLADRPVQNAKKL